MAVNKRKFLNTFLEGKSEKAYGVNYFLFQETKDVTGFSNSEFSAELQTDDDNALSLTSELASTALKSHSEAFSTEFPKSIRNSAGADKCGPEKWSAGHSLFIITILIGQQSII